MPTATYIFRPVIDQHGNPIQVPQPRHLSRQELMQLSYKQMRYPFHILEKPGDVFIVPDISMESSLRVQAAKRNRAGVHCYSISRHPLGLEVKLVSRTEARVTKKDQRLIKQAVRKYETELYHKLAKPRAR